MNNCAKEAFIFAVGIAVGAVVTYKYMSNKDAYIEEITVDEKRAEKDAVSYSQPEPSKSNYEKELTDILETYKTPEKESVNYSDMYKDDKDNEDKSDEKREEIHQIDPREYGEDTDYTFSFTLYSDGVLADELDDRILNPESRIGEGTLSDFMNADSDELYIRNEKTKSDYEIIKDERRYSDVVGD